MGEVQAPRDIFLVALGLTSPSQGTRCHRPPYCYQGSGRPSSHRISSQPSSSWLSLGDIALPASDSSHQAQYVACLAKDTASFIELDTRRVGGLVPSVLYQILWPRPIILFWIQGSGSS